jgi:4-oxalocrotonate tautomerase
MKIKLFGARLRVAVRAEPLKATQMTDWRKTMPLINVKMIEGVFTPTQKQEMVRKLTDTMVSIEGENMRPVTVVVVEEVKSGDWGIGGIPLTTDDAKALAAGKPKG